MPNAKKRTLYLLLSEFIQIRSPCHSPFCVFKSQESETQPRAGHTREQDTRARTGHTRELDTLFAPPSASFAQAFGCGAFRNPAPRVAEAYKEALTARAHQFDVVAFAVFHAGYGPDNYTPFAQVFADW